MMTINQTTVALLECVRSDRDSKNSEWDRIVESCGIDSKTQKIICEAIDDVMLNLSSVSDDDVLSSIHAEIARRSPVRAWFTSLKSSVVCFARMLLTA